MRLLAFVDLHGDETTLSNLKRKVKKENIDVVLCSGDFTTFGNQQKRLLKSISEFEVPVLLIHGNHEDPELLQRDCEKYENLIFLHCASFRMEDYIFFGFGGGGFSHEDVFFREMSKNFSKDMKENDKKILLIHGPPYGTKSDYTNGEHVGNKDYMDFISLKDIDLVVCGHIHETAETDEKVGKSRIINPGKKGIIVDL